jgi:hypothetical protein
VEHGVGGLRLVLSVRVTLGAEFVAAPWRPGQIAGQWRQAVLAKGGFVEVTSDDNGS